MCLFIIKSLQHNRPFRSVFFFSDLQVSGVMTWPGSETLNSNEIREVVSFQAQKTHQHGQKNNAIPYSNYIQYINVYMYISIYIYIYNIMKLFKHFTTNSFFFRAGILSRHPSKAKALPDRAARIIGDAAYANSEKEFLQWSCYVDGQST